MKSMNTLLQIIPITLANLRSIPQRLGASSVIVIGAGHRSFSISPK